MNQTELLRTLDELLGLPHETEWVEFKEAKNQYDFNKLGRYFSALSNEANLKSEPCGWLVFGVVNESRAICGSRFRENPADQTIVSCHADPLSKWALKLAEESED